MAEKKILVAQRGGHKSFTRQTLDAAIEIVEHYNEDHKTKLIAHKAILEAKLSVLDSLDNQILAKMEEEQEIEEDVIRSSKFKAEITEVIVRISELLNSKTTDRIVESSPSSSTSNSNLAKLLKLTIKPFDGNPLQFRDFWDNFNSAIDANESLDKVTKFNYHRSLLEGQAAAAAIAGLSLKADNYDNALKMIEDRFGNKQLLISTHIEKLMNLTAVTSSYYSKALRELYDNIETNIRSLQVLDVDSHHYGPILVTMIMNMVPNDIHLIISRALPVSEQWEIDELLKILKKEVESREMCSFMSKSATNNRHEHTEKGDYTASTLTVGAKYNENTGVSYTYCKRGHSSASCITITDLKARKTLLRNKAKCFVCHRSGHVANKCRTTYNCHQCKGRHHVSICENLSQKPYQENPAENTPKQVTSNVVTHSNSITFLQSAKVNITNCNNQNSLSIRVLFDKCSQRSFISTSTRDKLKLKTVRREKLITCSFGSEKGEMKELDIVKAKIWNANEALYRTIKLVVVPIICNPLSDQNIDLAKATYEHLISLPLADSSELDVHVLIGAAFYWNFVGNECIRGSSGGPVAIKTVLGWVLSGMMSTASNVTTNLTLTRVMKVSVEKVETLNDAVSKFWSLESIGVSEDFEYDAFEEFHEKVRFDGSNYVVSLPWKDLSETLPDNFALSKRHLEHSLKRLQRNPDLLKGYDNIIQEQERNGIVEAVVHVNAKAGQLHYIPHQEVVRQDKETTKVRVVYDASAKTRNRASLNDLLQNGPCLLPKIFDILIRFRCYKYAVTSDIKSAFLNIKVTEEDCDFLRFLWIDDIEKDNPELVVKRFTTLIFGMNCSPLLLGATIAHHMEKYSDTFKDIVCKFLADLYMDDCISGAQTEKDALDGV